MSLIEVEELLEEIDPETPSGENLEYDPLFGDLERSAQGKPEQQFGDTIVPSEEPEWNDVRDNALAVLSRSKDLRAAVHLGQSLSRTDGFQGICDTLGLVRGYVERYWETVHPQLDPEDDNDPTGRVNALAALADGATILRHLREAPLVEAGAMGRYTLRDIAIASGQIAAPDDDEATPPTAEEIAAAFEHAGADGVAEIAAAIDSALEHIEAIDAAVAEHVDAGSGPELDPLASVLREARRAITARIASDDDNNLLSDENDEDVDVDDPPHRRRSSASGAIGGPDDVVAAIDAICAYYAANEPSSPVPLLLRRAKRLVSKDFMALLKDLAPDGVSQLCLIAGVESDDENPEDVDDDE